MKNKNRGMKVNIVLGVENNNDIGAVVNVLTENPCSTIVVRFTPCGITGALGEHVFSNFGSGTPSGATTYWSKYCAFNPVEIRKEYHVLLSKGIKPRMVIDPEAPVTVHQDRDFIQRQSAGCNLYAVDLLYESIWKPRFNNILEYYGGTTCDEFQQAVHWLTTGEHHVVIDDLDLNQYQQVIFEGRDFHPGSPPGVLNIINDKKCCEEVVMIYVCRRQFPADFDLLRYTLKCLRMKYGKRREKLLIYSKSETSQHTRESFARELQMPCQDIRCIII